MNRSWLVRRLAGSLVTLILASAVAFVVLRLLPGDPVRLILGPFASASAIASERAALGLNQSIPLQYWEYIVGLLRGNWGFDYATGQPVITEIVARLPASLELGFYALVFAGVGALVLAVTTVLGHGLWGDRIARAVAFLALGSPPFWVGLVLLAVVSENLHWLPGPTGRLSLGTTAPPTITHFYTFDALLSGQFTTLGNAIAHLVLPAVALGFAPLGYLYRILRQSLLGVLDEDFLAVCEAKGLSRWAVLIRHALPNSLLPVLTAGGLLVAQLVAGSVLVETVFDWPGVGQLVVQSVLVKEYSVVEAFVILSVVAFVVVNAVVDISYFIIDPRLRRTVEEQ